MSRSPMKTRGSSVYHLMVAQNFLSSVDQHGQEESLVIPPYRSLKSLDANTCEESALVRIERSKQAAVAVTEQVVRSECKACSSACIHDRHYVGEAHSPTCTIDEDDPWTGIARSGSVNVAPFARSSSISLSQLVSSDKRVALKSMKSKTPANERVPLLRDFANVSFGKMTEKEEPECATGGKHPALSRRWHVFTSNGRCTLSSHSTSICAPPASCASFPARHSDDSHLSVSHEYTRRISSTSMDGSDIKPIDFRDVKEISFGDYLVSSNTTDETPGRTSNQACADFTRSLEETCLVMGEPSTSFARYTNASWSRGRQRFSETSLMSRSSISDAYPIPTYDPNLLSRFERLNSPRITTLKSDGYITTLFSFSSEEEVKRVTNDKFRTQYPQVQITYSKIKSIKREMHEIAKVCDLDELTLAHSYVFYEKVVLKGMVKKPNRKLVAGVSLLVATKINDHGSVRLSSIVDHIETVFRLNRKEMLQLEIPLCVALDFNLNATQSELLPHLQRICLTVL